MLSNVAYGLAEGYYRQENYPKAQRWFHFTGRTAKHWNPIAPTTFEISSTQCLVGGLMKCRLTTGNSYWTSNALKPGGNTVWLKP